MVIANHSLSASHMETTRKLLKTMSVPFNPPQFASLEHRTVSVISENQYVFLAKVSLPSEVGNSCA